MINVNSAVIIGMALIAIAPSTGQQRVRGAVQLEAADCSRYQASFGKDEVAYTVQRASVPAAGARLDVEPGQNGGIRVERGAGTEYSITACIAAGGETTADAQRAAEAVRIQIDGNRVRVANATELRHASVHLIIEAPAGAQIDAKTTNGPISIHEVDGSFTARATNGPIALTNVSGAVRAAAANGPISVSGSGGNLDVETQNGPISINLQGTQWAGELNARAQNGPLTVRVADNFTSGVEISSSRRSPWNCRIAACRSDVTNPGMANDDRGTRTVNVGSGPVVVKLSTVNGPVTLDSAR